MSTNDEQGLAEGVADVVDDVNATGESVFVLRDGEPVAALFPFTDDAVADWILGHRRPRPASARPRRHDPTALQIG